MSTPLIFQDKDNNKSIQSRKGPSIFNTQRSSPAIFGGTAQQPTQQPTQPIQKPTFGSRVKDVFSTAKERFQAGFKEGGLGAGVANIIDPVETEAEKARFNQNIKTYVEGTKGEEIVTEIVFEVGKEIAKQVGGTGVAVSGLIAPDSLTEFDRKILEARDFLDETGNIKPGKTAVETAKTVGNLAVFFPNLFAPSGLIEGGKTIDILGKAVPVAKVVAGTVESGVYFTLYTPNLENIFTDKEVAGEAGKQFLTGLAVGALVTIPLNIIKAPNAAVKLSADDLAEARGLYYSLAKKYHPDSKLMGDAEAFKILSSKYKAGDIAWLRSLKKASPAQAEKLFGMKIKNINAFGGLLTEKAGNAPSTTARETIKVKGVSREVTGSSISIRPDGTASFNIEVAESARGRGVGAETVKQIEDTILSKNITEVVLPVKEESIGFFEKQGYTQTGEVKRELVTMEKTLKKGTVKVEGKPVSTPQKKKEGVTKPKVKAEEEYLYHSTPGKNIASISKHGLTPNIIGNKIFFGTDEATATSHIEKYLSEGNVLRIKKSAVKVTGEVDSKVKFSSETINPKNIEIKVGDTWKPLVAPKPKAKVVKVAPGTLPIGEGEVKVSRLEARVKNTLDNVSKEQIEKLELTTYNVMNKKDTIRKAAEYVINNEADAMKVLTGEIAPPKGLNPNSIYVAMERNASENFELATKLASLRSTAMGQNLSLLAELDPNSPVKFLNEIYKIKESTFKRRSKGKTKGEVRKKSLAVGKAKMKAPSEVDWNFLISEVRC